MAITKRTLTRVNSAGETTKRVVWRARVPDPSRPAAASVKIERTFARRSDAERWETQQRHSIASGSYIASGAASTPLRQVSDAWREQWSAKPLSPRTQLGYASLLDNHILPRFGDVKVSAIDAKSIQGWINELAKTHRSETCHHAYTVLRQVLKVAVSHKLITSNPCSPDAITLPSKRADRAKQPEQLALTAHELRQLIDATPPHWRLAVKVAGLMGLRAGELWGLRRCDIDLLHGTLHVRFALKDLNGTLIVGSTKTHQSRSLSLPKPLIGDLSAALTSPGVKIRRVRRSKGSGDPMLGGYPAIIGGELTWTADASDPQRLLFTTLSGAPVSHNNFYARVWRPTINALWAPPHRLNRLRIHDLRHTSASLMMSANGGNLAQIQKRLGHSSIVTTIDRYSHMLPDADKNLADALGQMFDATEPPSNVIELEERRG